MEIFSYHAGLDKVRPENVYMGCAQRVQTRDRTKYREHRDFIEFRELRDDRDNRERCV